MDNSLMVLYLGSLFHYETSHKTLVSRKSWHNMFFCSLYEETNSFIKQNYIALKALYFCCKKRMYKHEGWKIKYKYGTLSPKTLVSRSVLKIIVKSLLPRWHIPDYGTLCPYWGYWWVLQGGCPAESTCAQLRRVDPDGLAHNYRADTDTSMTTCGHSCSVPLETCHSLSSLRLLSVKSKCLSNLKTNISMSI